MEVPSDLRWFYSVSGSRVDRIFAAPVSGGSIESIGHSGRRFGSRVFANASNQPALVRWSSCDLKLGQHNTLLVLVFALAIRIADFAGFIPAEEQNLAQPFVGINLGR
jgi:hypothetical protein